MRINSFHNIMLLFGYVRSHIKKSSGFICYPILPGLPVRDVPVTLSVFRKHFETFRMVLREGWSLEENFADIYPMPFVVWAYIHLTIEPSYNI